MKIPNIRGLAGIGKAFVMANRPEILFGASMVSTVAAVVAAGRAGYVSGQQVLIAEFELPEEEVEVLRSNRLDFKDKLQLTWLNYLPAAGLTAGALGSTTGLHIVHVKEKKALAAAALMAIEEIRNEANEYKDEVVKVVKENTTEKKGAELEEKINNIEPAPMVVGEGMYLVTDMHTGRTFYGSENKIQSALNEVNRILQGKDLELNSFYVWAGMPEIQDGMDYGWNRGEFVTVSWEDGHLPSGQPTREFTFRPKPKEGFDSTPS